MPAELSWSGWGDHAARARHALGRSTLDPLALRAGAPLPVPNLVLTPGDAGEVTALLALCSGARVAVVPFGGGTLVVGGLTPQDDGFAGWVALDLRRLDALHDLDETSRLATLGPGLRGPDAEAMLGARGYTIGHFPQSYEYASLSGFAAARSSGQASAGYGRFDDLVAGLRVATPAGGVPVPEAGEGWARERYRGPYLRDALLDAGAIVETLETVTFWREVPDLYAAVAGGQTRRRCRDPRPRRLDQPPPRGRPRPSRGAGPGARGAGHRGPARSQGSSTQQEFSIQGYSLLQKPCLT